MPDDRPLRRYCGLIQLKKSSDLRRVAEAVPGLMKLVQQWSNGDMEQLCRSNDGQLSGFLFATRKPVEMLAAEFESSFSTVNGDEFIVFEIGEKCSSSGWKRPLAWIQH